MSKLIDLTGKKFGMLTVVSLSKTRKNGAVWVCKCACGKIVESRAGRLKRGMVKSCGCGKSAFISQHVTTHGLSQHLLYRVWTGMLDRCYKKDNSRFKNYGGRGISVCEEWLKVEVFVEWAVYNGWKPDLQIDRVDNDGNYCPENCRFVTNWENSLNKTTLRSDNKSGYCGVSSCSRSSKNFAAYIKFGLLRRHIGTFKTAKEAAIARDQYIIDNNLPHRLQVLTRD